eukprot:CAMPEP_0185433746 /NCGR_PEP_ID=MMETSP1365-20130426/22048_1 /TAXON_ID=38817 /ORGANISM="Gephyrocapsa oceanica, Strain RCC1303" /LENGTH=324 /DNA_ID=CAMNT_0028038255 /DNA_START=80 /DNA_END=1052 /DNA_ORIENTATION=-
MALASCGVRGGEGGGAIHPMRKNDEGAQRGNPAVWEEGRGHVTPAACVRLSATRLELVLVLGDGRDHLLEALALPDAGDELDRVLVGEGVAGHRIPVVEDELREGLAARVLAEEGGEAERLRDGQVRLDGPHWGTGAVDLLDHLAALARDGRVRLPLDGLGALDLAHEDGLLQPRRRRHHRGEEAAARGRDDLAAAAVDGVGVQHNVVDVDHDVAARLVAERALLAHPLPARHHRVLNLVQVLHAHRHVHHEVRAGAVGAKAPDLLRRLLVPAELVDEHARARLRVHARRDLALLDGVREGRLRVVLAVAERQRLAVEAVVLVG